jgi:uncharacterized membrane protein YoaK (UPF0700 family)
MPLAAAVAAPAATAAPAAAARRWRALAPPLLPLLPLLLLIPLLLLLLLLAAPAAEAPSAQTRGTPLAAVRAPNGRTLDFPPDARDAAALSLIAASLILAASSGIGGGGLFVPILTSVAQFDLRRAVALSTVTVLGGAMANFAFNLRRTRGRSTQAPLIDWGLILAMEPTTMVGAVAGAYLNR